MLRTLRGERSPWALPALMVVISTLAVMISGYTYTGRTLERLENRIHAEQVIRDAEFQEQERSRDLQWCSILTLILQNDPRKGPAPTTPAGKERVSNQIRFFLAVQQRAREAGCEGIPK